MTLDEIVSLTDGQTDNANSRVAFVTENWNNYYVYYRKQISSLSCWIDRNIELDETSI